MIRVLFTDPQILFFNNFFIKNESHCTIHIFKNYFAIVFLILAKISSTQIDPRDSHMYFCALFYLFRIPPQHAKFGRNLSMSCMISQHNEKRKKKKEKKDKT